MPNVKVRKITNNRSNFRTPLEYLNEMPYPPEIGRGLLLTSTNYESGGIKTSPVESWTYDSERDLYIVKTSNSTYEIELLF